MLLLVREAVLGVCLGWGRRCGDEEVAVRRRAVLATSFSEFELEGVGARDSLERDVWVLVGAGSGRAGFTAHGERGVVDGGGRGQRGSDGGE